MTQIVNGLSVKGVQHKTTAPTLRLRNISTSYVPGTLDIMATNASLAVEGVSFDIDRGERVAVVGPNGAGKSTLFKLIVGIIKPQAGTIQIYGSEPGVHICIGYVPQRSVIDWSFPVTVEDVVMMGRVGKIGLFRRPKRQDWQIVHHSLDRVGAKDLAHAQIGDISGGQQQRVFIARALAQEAELLLMDEPLSGLDTPSQKAIFEILDGLRPDGVTVIIATHNLDIAAAHFDRVMLLNRRVIAFDVPTAVFSTENLVQAYGGHLHRIGSAEKGTGS